MRVASSGGQAQGTALLGADGTAVWPTGGTPTQLVLDFWVEAWQALGGQSASSLGALRYLLQQLEELRVNWSLQPVYLQLFTTAQTSPIYPSRADARDGWYSIDAFQADPETYNGRGACEATATLTRIAPGAPARSAMYWTGGALPSNFSGVSAAKPIVGFPLNSTSQPLTQISRTGAEGAIPLTLNPISAVQPAPFIQPLPFVLSATVADWWKGGCRVYDTGPGGIGSNAVPSPPGTFNANWIRVYGSNHDFQGDMVVTNGLLLLVFQAGQSRACQVWLWNTALTPTVGWQQVADLQVADDAGNQGTLTGYSIQRVGLEEVRIWADLMPSTGHPQHVRIRMQRGRYDMRLDYRQWISGTTGNFYGPNLNLIAAPKAIWNDSAATDGAVGNTSLTPSTNAGWVAALVANSADPFLIGFLYQNQPVTAQPGQISSLAVPLGDSAPFATGGPGALLTYGFWAVPFATPQNLQAEGESGSMGTGWSSVADGAASGGNTAKAASGTVSGNADLFGTAWQPAAESADVWFRVRVTSAAGSAAEMTLGLWDATAGAFVTGGSTTFRANQASTSYVWLKANSTTPVTVPAGHNVQFRAVTAGTLGTDWFIDEAFLSPASLTAAFTGPSDLFQQFAYEREVRMIRP